MLRSWWIKSCDHINGCRNSIWQNSTSVNNKNSQKNRKKNFLNIIKSIYQKNTPNIINDERTNAFHLQVEKRKLLLNIVLEVLNCAIRQEKEMIGMRHADRKERKKENYAYLQVTWLPRKKIPRNLPKIPRINEFSKVGEYKINIQN